MVYIRIWVSRRTVKGALSQTLQIKISQGCDK